MHISKRSHGNDERIAAFSLTPEMSLKNSSISFKMFRSNTNMFTQIINDIKTWTELTTYFTIQFKVLVNRPRNSSVGAAILRPATYRMFIKSDVTLHKRFVWTGYNNVNKCQPSRWYGKGCLRIRILRHGWPKQPQTLLKNWLWKCKYNEIPEIRLFCTLVTQNIKRAVRFI